jgi:hypothetical protein
MALHAQEDEQLRPLDPPHDGGFGLAELEGRLPETGAHSMLLSRRGRFRLPADHIPAPPGQPPPFDYSTDALGRYGFRIP